MRVAVLADIHGNKIFDYEFYPGKNKMMAEEFFLPENINEGIYFLLVSTAEKTICKKLIVE